uniref:Natriuretic protein n=1 Tax=Gorilla gorilla TaxID=9593 RepID=Q9N2E7_9PRIM|nr:natriuretic protein [Gorilla gorilla]
MDPQTAPSRALLLLLFLHLAFLGGRSHPLGSPGSASDLETSGLQGAAQPFAGQTVGAAGGADIPGAPPGEPPSHRCLEGPGGSHRGHPWAPQNGPLHPAGTTKPQDGARVWLLWEEDGPDQLLQWPGLQMLRRH